MYKDLEAEAKKALAAGVITLQQYEEIARKLKELQEKIAELPQNVGKGLFDGVKLNFGENIQGFLEKAAASLKGKLKGAKLFGDTITDEQAGAIAGAAAEAISQSYSLATDIMNNFFDAEQSRIQDNLDLQLERMEIEKDQVLARAESQAEIDSIEKQYAAKKKEAERKAQQDLKRAKRSEAKIALAAELANIWASVWQLGPIAGPIAGVIFSGLALGRYAVRSNEIDREKFAMGGKPGDVPTHMGKFGGKPHSKGGTDFQFRGRGYNAEAKELAVIRTRNAPAHKKYSVSGTQMEIASAINKIGGGVHFKPGASIKQFESGGYLGQSLQPPVFTPINSSSINIDNSDILSTVQEQANAMQEQAKSIQALSQRIDRLQVVQVTSTVTAAQAKQVKQSSTGML